MKRHLLIFLLILTSIHHGRTQNIQEYLFFSNISQQNEIEALLTSRSDLKDNTELISLGDNKLEVLEDISSLCPTCNFSTVIGDRDTELLTSPTSKKFKFKKKRICPDPIIKEIDDSHVMIVLNSNWFIDRSYKFDAQNYDCEYFNEIHLLEGLEDILDDYKDWNKIIVAHHGLASISEIAGKGLSFKKFIPLFGPLYSAFRKNIGFKQDLTSPGYHRYISLITKITSKFDKLTFISGHDRINHVLNEAHLTHINVNSSEDHLNYSRDKNTTYASDQPQILSLRKHDKGWKFEFISATGSEEVGNIFKTVESQPQEGSTAILESAKVEPTVQASYKYNAGGTTRFFMGEGYRAEWSELVTAPILDIDKFDGGLKPYAIGGGLQTMSIKFKSGNGKKYAFRVLDKQPEKSLSEIARESVYRVITQELITTMHPYGPLVANALLDATDIIHIKPELFILEQNPLLEDKFQPFVGKIGTLEEKPSGKKKGREGFYGADKVVSTYDMFLSIRKSHKNRLDPLAYAKARLMDMLLGDWDRHEDNWKWAMFKKDGRRFTNPFLKIGIMSFQNGQD